jgi:hypothetical protein
MMAVDTTKVERRKLRFESIDDLLLELRLLEEAQAAGRVSVTGNWNVAQVLSHIAAWIEYGWIGYPVKAPPIFIRWILKLMVRRMINSKMPVGVKIRGVKGGTVGQDDVPFDQAIARLRSCLQRLKDGELSKFDSPAFGPLSHEDRIRLNLRHAELHLSFVSYQSE